MIITVLTHIIYGEQAKITHSVFIKGGIYIILMAILVFFGNWILNTIANNASNVRIKIALDRLGKIIRTLPSDFFTYLKGEYLWDI
ncbi:hypothetical protein NW062_04225 [Mycoplasmopsis cynos]|nr:hypothetical protein NW062_04225 [Mycoplasmopsis cynos]